MKHFWYFVLLVTVLLTMSMEEPMAVKNNNQTAAKPALGGGGNKNMDQVAQRPDSYKPNKPLNPKNKEDMPLRGGDGVPAWMMPFLGGAITDPTLLGAAMGGAGDILEGMVDPAKDSDTLGRRLAKPFDQLQLKNKLFDTLTPKTGMGSFAGSGSGNFGSSYGSNWRRGYGGGGGGYSGGYDSAPAWWNAYLRLNNWNI